MKMRNSALEKVAVKKVKHEVDTIIEAACAKLEEYVENESDTSLLKEVSASLVQVERTLQLVQINGAAVLAREMCDVVDGLIDNSIKQQDKAQECLSRGILQMSDYLEYVQAGNKDLPVVLLPLLNDLRGVREAPLLSEHILFFPDLDDIDVPSVSVQIGMPAQEYAKKIRYGYQIGLVSIIQNKEIDIAATKMCKVAIRLHQCSTQNASRRLWWVASAIAQALAIEVLPTSMGLASLLGQVDRQIKKFIELDEASFAKQIPIGLIKNLLYYVGIAQDRGRIVSKVKQAYGLGDLIPNEMDINKMREGMSGPSADVLEAVSKALHEDIETVKDLIEVYVHSKNRSPESVSVVSTELQKIADTLSMLGLDEPREDIVREVNTLNGLSAEELEHADSNFIAIAETLIKAESIVENFVNYSLLNKPAVQAVDSEDDNLNSSGDSNQLRKIQIQTITEALSEIEEAKNTISQLLTSPEDEDKYAIVQDHFRKVIGALSMLNLDDAVKILEYIQAYLLDANATQELSSQADKLDAFADSITSVECYLEALVVDEGDLKEILEYGVNSASKLVGNEIELSSNPETLSSKTVNDVPLQTVEVEEFAAEDDSPSLLSANDLELKKKLKTPQSSDLSNATVENPDTKNSESDELDLEALSATTLDLSLDFDLFDSQAEAQVEENCDELESTTANVASEDEDNTELLELPVEDEQELELSPELAELQSNNIKAATIELNNIASDDIDLDLADENEDVGVVGVDLDATNLLDFDEIQEQLSTDIKAVNLNEHSGTVHSEPTPPSQENMEEYIDGLDQAPLFDGDETELLLPEMISEDSIVSELEQTHYSITINSDGVEHNLLANRGDADPEVLKIYIEEAEEEVEKINLNRTIWKDDEDNNDALIIVRRSFHTLKGGGRLIGAEIIGEYTWQIENILNKVIDESVAVSSNLHQLLENSVALLNELVLQLKTNREPAADVVRLYTEAQNFIDNQKTLSQNPSVLSDDAAEDVLDVELDQNDAIQTNIEVVNIDVDELRDIEEQDESQNISDNIDGDLLEDSLSENSIPDESLPEEPLEDELYALFLDEAKQHINTLENLIEPKQEHKILSVDETLLHALHTLFGCSRTAQVDVVAKLIGTLDKYCQECNQNNHKIKAQQFDVLVECIEYVKQSISQNSSDLKQVEVNHELLEKVNNLSSVSIPALEDVSAQAEIIEDVFEDASKNEAESGPKHELDNEPEHNLEKTQKITLADTNISANELPDNIDVYEDKDNELVEIFLEEANDILQVCNECLAKWRDNHKDQDAVAEFRRQLHTLKGSARMATYSNIGDLSHSFEAFVIDIAEARINTEDSVFDVGQKCLDHLNEMVDLAAARQAVFPATNLIPELTALRSVEDYSTEQPSESNHVNDNAEEIKTTSKLEIDTKRNEVAVSESKNREHKLKRVKKNKKVKIPVLRDPVELGVQQDAQPVISGQQAVRLQSSMLDNFVNNAGEVNIFQARLEQVGTNYHANIHELEQVVDRLREQLRNLEIETETQILSRHAHEVPENETFDPLELDRYSNIQQLSRSLAESVNDLLSIKDILSDQVRESELLLAQQRRISGDLQEGLMRTRMVPFSQIVLRLQRIVRQTSRDLGKDADLKVVGQSTEIDSSILNRIVAPLEHLVRNAISHGIEETDKRETANKSKQGEIKIDVTREGAEIVIIVSDDGAGLDVEKIKSKAQEMGLLVDADMPERELLNLILTPGFSTAGQVSQVSGRGVGMDVVASELKQLGGSLQIESDFGKGASFYIRIPFTLAITQSLLIKTGNEIYAVPLASVEGVVRLSAHELKQKYAEHNSSYHYADRDYRLCHLGSLLDVGKPQLGGADKMFPVLLVRSGDLRMAIHVEATLGNREVVVKPLALQLSRLPTVSGATILGDGNVVLILDIQGLIRVDLAQQLEHTAENPDEPFIEEQPIVLVVDDSITIRKVTTRFLERNNYKVETAKDGIDAVQKLQDFTPALILLDIEMPRMDGFELATHIRNNERLKHVPIIMITSRTGDKHRQRAMDIGVQEYLGKPYNESELLSYVKSVVQ
jgi:chemosensory pili system protein ChpA (sensor histidine kinase/response regulator)